MNLAGSNPESFERSDRPLAEELRNAPTFGARFVNVHIGSHTGQGVTAGTDPARGRGPAHLRRSNATDDARCGHARGDARPRELRRQRRRSRHRASTSSAGIAEAIRARGIDDRRDRVLPGHGPRLGRRAGHGRSPSTIDDTMAAFDDRIGLAAAGHGPSQRLALRARVADRTATSTAAGLIGAAGLAHVLRHPAWPTPPTCWRPRAWTRATTPSTSSGRAPSRRRAPGRPAAGRLRAGRQRPGRTAPA